MWPKIKVHCDEVNNNFIYLLIITSRLLLTFIFTITLFCYLQALKGMAATFRIASSNIIKTAAERRLSSTDSVLAMLKWVERHFSRRKPRANSLTYKSARKAKDSFHMHMTYQIPPKTSPRNTPPQSPDKNSSGSESS